jgi:hypothetical protein
MKTNEKIKRNGEYSEYKRIIKMVNTAHKKALIFTKTDFQKKLERAYISC